MFPGWEAFATFPRWRLYEILRYYKHKKEEGLILGAIERQILSAVSKMFPEPDPEI